MKINYWAPHVTVAAIVEQDNKFLLVEENVEGEIVINQPAGHLEPGESLTDAVIRETLEETGFQVEPGYMTGIYQWVHPNEESYLRFCYTANVIKEEKHVELDQGIIRPLWLSVDEMESASNLRSPLVLESVKGYLQGNRVAPGIVQTIL